MTLKNKLFNYWMIEVVICFIFEMLGNTAIPELKGVGIVAAIMFVIIAMYELHFDNKITRRIK